MTNQELFERARAACNDYYMVFGSFPEKIGVRYDRLKSFPFGGITLNLPLKAFTADLSLEPVARHDLFQVQFWPVMGAMFSDEEVYLPRPGKAHRAISGKRIRQLAERQKVAES